ncbi:carbon catabolite repressor protein 4 homolog 3-like [Coffea eugenioides]|uniref:carbon catabolite repressor protein 4 homolog 3-like n=1 Tax=Coffea eugenioides TaxID=49369 RepID=UPI000F607D81|nr:carbon catabolite repressor protein 4 homolog 3-like [Coffea eugenioides]
MGCCLRAAPSSSFLLTCVKGPANSKSSSYSRRWYNPVRRKSSLLIPDTDRQWVTADNNRTHLLSEERFTVVSYNILGDRNAFKHWDLYRNVPSIYLKWDYRKRVICEELIGLNPDIICLQEVDKYFDVLNIMEKAGYLGSYKRRTGDYADGCAMFWKADKFQLIEGESIEFKQYGLRDNVAQVSVFEMRKAKSRRILVGNIHVLYNPRRGDVKLGQIRFLLSRASILSKKWGNTPVVLAGDYNSTPQSAIYTFFSSSELNIMLHDRGDLSGQKNCRPTQALGIRREQGSLFVWMDRFLHSSWTNEEIKSATGGTDSRVVRNPLKLRSSYAMVKGSAETRSSNGEPLATSYHSKFLGTVDYLWFSDGIVPTKVMDTLPINVLKKIGGLPCQKFGSDHLPLVSEFAFIQGSKDENETSNFLIS